MTVVYIAGGVESISDYAFRGCSKLSLIYIPESATSISAWAFYENDLNKMIIYGKPESYAQTYANGKSITFIEDSSENGFAISILNSVYDYDEEEIYLGYCIINSESQIVDGVALIGVYDSNNKLIKMKREDISISNNIVGPIEVSIPFPYVSDYRNYTVKVFLWNGFNQLKPFATAASKNL